ncbi:MAG: hypothetical protein AB2A00_02260 [Myxococcota bacterium]
MMLMTPLFMVGLTATAEPAAPPEKPSLAVLSLTASEGVSEELRKAVNHLLLDEIRATRQFSRVISTKDVEDMLSLERQRQLMDCDSSSCIAEIAGALGADQILSVSLTKVASSMLLTLRLLDARRAQVLAYVTERVKAGDEEQVIDLVRPAVRRLVTPADEAAERNPTGKALLGAGVSGVVVSGVLFVAALGNLGLLVASQVVPRVVALPFSYEVNFVLVYGAAGLFSVVGAALLLGAVATGGGGLGLLVWSLARE